jgi:putative membrane protein
MVFFIVNISLKSIIFVSLKELDMRRSLKEYFVIGLKGMAMGAADVVPGVSGGTIAFISGIYEELLSSISNVNLGLFTTLKSEGLKSAWKQLNGNFLAALFVGIFISIISLAKAIKYLLENEPILLWSFFFGLVLASIIYIAKQITKWNLISCLVLILGAILAFYITTLNPLVSENSSPLFIFLAGTIAICAMILPGISGSFILVLLGAYKPVLDAVNNRDFKTILVFMAGAIVGLLAFSRVLKWLFKHYKNYTLAVLTGFIIGSLNKIWPWKLTQSVFDKSSGTIVAIEEVTNLGSLPVYQKEINNFETYKIALEKSVSPFQYSEANLELSSQLVGAVILAIVGFALILLMEKLAVKKQ